MQWYICLSICLSHACSSTTVHCRVMVTAEHMLEIKLTGHCGCMSTISGWKVGIASEAFASWLPDRYAHIELPLVGWGHIFSLRDTLWDADTLCECGMCLVQMIEESVSEADTMMDCMSVYHAEWKSKLRRARSALRTLLADSLLAAGYLVYCGPLEQPLHDSLLSDWLSQCETVDSSCVASSGDLSASGHRLIANDDYSLEDMSGFAELLPELETCSGMLTDVGSRRNAALVYSCLFCRSLQQRSTFLIDPDKQAESCIRFILEHASSTSRASSRGEIIVSWFWFMFAVVAIQVNHVLLSLHFS